MSKLSTIDKHHHVKFMCPGCKQWHAVRCNTNTGVTWSWNQDNDKPTFSPSILVKGSKLTDKGSKDMEEWIKNGYPKQNKKFDSVNTICHSFITNGEIQFLDDCTHELKGQTVELPEWREEE